MYMLALGRLKVFGRVFAPTGECTTKAPGLFHATLSKFGQVAVEDHCEVPKKWLGTRIQAPHVVPEAYWHQGRGSSDWEVPIGNQKAVT